VSETILVTGASGYIGLHTVQALRAAELRVVGLDRRPPPSRAALAGARFELGDVRHRHRVEVGLRRHGVTTVVHCAGLKSAPESTQQPGRYFAHNVGGTLALLTAMGQAGVDRLVFSSSCGVYGTPGDLPVTEASPLRPENPYAESKVLAERMLPWFEARHGIRWVALRYFNAAGVASDRAIGEDPRSAAALVPVVMRAASGDGPPVTIHGTDYPTRDGTPVRDYVHVADIVEGHRLALAHLGEGGRSAVVNLGRGHGTSVREVVDLAGRVVGHPVPAVNGPRRPGDPAEVWADRSLARSLLGWEPRHSLEDILVSAWAWQGRARGRG
jgi:UDP-glucose-4-epimerase GalE